MSVNMNRIIIILVSLFLLGIVSCKKEGKGGKSIIKGSISHHGVSVPGLPVYIKYGAVDFPGSDISNYDDETSVNSQGEYRFEELRKGDYFLFSNGFDNQYSEFVSGGVSVNIRKNEEKNVVIPVN